MVVSSASPSIMKMLSSYEWTWAGTHRGPLTLPDGTEVPATGKRAEATGAEIVRFRDGKVVEHNLYFDNLAAMAQLGLLPE